MRICRADANLGNLFKCWLMHRWATGGEAHKFPVSVRRGYFQTKAGLFTNWMQSLSVSDHASPTPVRWCVEELRAKVQTGCDQTNGELLWQKAWCCPRVSDMLQWHRRDLSVGHLFYSREARLNGIISGMSTHRDWWVDREGQNIHFSPLHWLIKETIDCGFPSHALFVVSGNVQVLLRVSPDLRTTPHIGLSFQWLHPLPLTMVCTLSAKRANSKSEMFKYYF